MKQVATVNTMIQLQDRVSAPINHILNALNHTVTAFEAVQRAGGGSIDTSALSTARAEINAANATYEELVQKTRQTNDQIQNNVDAQEQFTNEVDRSSQKSGNLLKKVGAVVAMYASIRTVDKMLDLSDELTQTTARLNMMNDGLQTTEQLQQMIYQSAQKSRGQYQQTAAAVSKMGIMAKDAFSSNVELVAFAEQLNKQFTIAGTSAAGIDAAMLQLTQAMGSGVLRGEELNSVFEQAPTIIQAIAGYLGVPIGEIRAMAQEGQITADIVKNALLSAADETNAKFESMPMTFSQVGTKISNAGLMAFQPIFNRLSALANSDDFNVMVNNSINALVVLADFTLDVFNAIGSIAGWVYQNWSILEPVVMGLATALGIYTVALITNNTVQGIHAALVAASTFAAQRHAAALMMESGATFAATAAQYGFNAALLACPVVWILLIIIAVIAAIYAVIAAINKVTGSSISATGLICGALATAGAFVWNLFLSTLEMILGVINYLINPFLSLANFFANVFVDPIGSIINLFGSMADNVLGILQKIASAIDLVFGSSFAATVEDWRAGLNAKVETAAATYGNGKYEEVVSTLDLSVEDLGLNRIAYTNAWEIGYDFGDSMSSKATGAMTDIFSNDEGIDYLAAMNATAGDIADGVGSMSDSLACSEEDLKYLRDIAERDIINRFTTAELKVDFTANSTIKSDLDLDGIVSQLEEKVSEVLEASAEGVHN